MLNRSGGKQDKLIVTTLEQLMPEEHFLRELEKHVDFSFIYEKVAHMYSNLGRKSVDPIVLIKMLLLGFLYGIDSERKLEKEVQVNIAFRWFLGIDLDESVPDHSTISQTRRRRWRGTNMFEDIFTEIVRTCITVGLVDGSLILTDSTHVKANADSGRKETVTIKTEPSEYIKKLDILCEQEDVKVRAKAMSEGKSQRGRKPNGSPQKREVEQSTTDPDCGMLGRPGKPKGFHYLNHQSSDGKSGIITDVYVTAGNREDFEPYASRIKQQIARFHFPIQEVGLDRGYDKEEVHKEMFDLGIKTYAPLIDMEKITRDRVFPPSAFQYVEEKDVFICPNACELYFSCVNKHYHKKIYRARAKDCTSCLIRQQCIGGKTASTRVLHISFFKKEIDSQRANCGTERYYEVQKRRRCICEGNFAIQKENHNLRRTRKRGNEAVTEHCLCSALALNLKRLVKFLGNLERSPAPLGNAFGYCF